MLALGLPAADNLRQNVSSFEEPASLFPRVTPSIRILPPVDCDCDERRAIELKLKYMAQK